MKKNEKAFIDELVEYIGKVAEAGLQGHYCPMDKAEVVELMKKHNILKEEKEDINPATDEQVWAYMDERSESVLNLF